MTMTLQSPDFATIKQKQQATWGSGDYSTIGTTLQIVGERLCESVDIRSGERVLDVAAGNGNATLAAARHFADVTSTDYVPSLLERAEERAVAERLSVAFKVADAEALPFGDGSFDVVLSSFGVMFTPDQEKAASEMSRVLRKGGRIGLANWTPGGFIGQLFKVLGRHVSPPAGVRPPSLWGTEARLAELFPGHKISAKTQLFHFRYRSAAHFVQVFRTYYGPTHKAFASLDVTRAATLEADMLDLLHSRNQGGKDSLVVPSEYLEVVLVRS
jgi:SAM-dependent methyltransferase